jgi:hypothetical protein
VEQLVRLIKPALVALLRLPRVEGTQVVADWIASLAGSRPTPTGGN